MVCSKFTAKMFYTILLHVVWPTSIHGPLSHWKKSLWPLRLEFEYHHSTIAAKLWIMNMNFWIHTRQWSTKVAVLCSMLCSMLFHVATVSNVIARSLTWCLPTSYYMFVSLEQLCVCIWVSREREGQREPVFKAQQRGRNSCGDTILALLSHSGQTQAWITFSWSWKKCGLLYAHTAAKLIL